MSALAYSFLDVRKNIAYGDDSRQTMDLYMPKTGGNNHTLVVFVYGGAWRTGSKNYYSFMGKYFARRGYPTIIPDYRLYPDVQFPVFIDDVALAIQKAVNSSGQSYTDIILAGHSAGGHTAALLTVDPSYFNEHDIHLPIKAFIGLSAPYDLPFDEELTPIFETANDDRDLTNPIALARMPLPPILLLHGSDDMRVGLHHSKNFTEKLESLGAPVQAQYFDDYSHMGIITRFLPFINSRAAAPRVTDAFLRDL